jgi:transposase InsO family protein
VLAAHRRAADAAGIEWKSAVYGQIKEENKLDQGLTIARMAKLGHVSRTGYYRFGVEAMTPVDPDMDLRDAIQRIALQWPSYGRPRITAELRRRGWKVNHKRVGRILKEDNLLCLRRRKFVITTNSAHGWAVYPNLAGEMVLTGLNQLWIADITYIRLEVEFVYLAVVLDAYSRRVIGWALDRTLEAKLAIEALQMALRRRRPAPGLVHHSDRGVQYACADYAARLAERQIQRSMSRPGNPYENAKAESFMKTLKGEEVDGRAYADLDQARSSIGQFLEEVYNADRLHSALGYKSPVDFENALTMTVDTRENETAALSPN